MLAVLTAKKNLLARVVKVAHKTGSPYFRASSCTGAALPVELMANRSNVDYLPSTVPVW